MNTITITKNTIEYKHQIINTSNISLVDLKETRPKNDNFILLIALGLAIAAYYYFNEIEIAKDMIPSLSLGALSVLFFYLNYNSRKASHKFILFVKTNSGEEKLFSNRDYKFINNIRLKIQESLNSETESFSVTYNIDNKTEINNPIGNITITNVKNYTGLSDEDKEFIAKSFEPAMAKLQSEIEKSASEEHKRNYELIKQELKSSAPRQPIMQAGWEALKGLGSVAEIAGIINQGIALF